jgi:hypothetical protein
MICRGTSSATRPSCGMLPALLSHAPAVVERVVISLDVVSDIQSADLQIGRPRAGHKWHVSTDALDWLRPRIGEEP